MQNKIIFTNISNGQIRHPHPIYFSSGSPKLVSMALQPMIKQLTFIRNQLEKMENKKSTQKEEKKDEKKEEKKENEGKEGKKIDFVDETNIILEKLAKIGSFSRKELKQKEEKGLNEDQIYKMLTPFIA